MGRYLVSALAAAVIVSWPTPGWSSTPLESLPCTQQVFDLLDGWEIPTQWSPRVSADPAVKVLQSPTGSLGVWLRLRVSGSSTVAARMTENTVTEVTLQAPECRQQLRVIRRPEGDETPAPQGRFTDADLSPLLEKSKAGGELGLIYVWSPHMNLSVRGLHEAIAYSKKLGVVLTVVLDPRAQHARAEAVLKDGKLPMAYLRRLNSSELIQRQALLHFPAYQFYRNGELTGYARLGYDDAQAMEQRIARLKRGGR